MTNHQHECKWVVKKAFYIRMSPVYLLWVVGSVAIVLFLDLPIWKLWVFLGFGIVGFGIATYLGIRLVIWMSKKNPYMRFHGICCQLEEAENNDNIRQ